MKTKLILLLALLWLGKYHSGFGQTDVPGGYASGEAAMEQKDLQNLKFYSPEEIQALFTTSLKQAAFSKVVSVLQSKGFKRLQLKEANWGFSADLKNPNGSVEKSSFMAFDFFNPEAKQGQGASVIVRTVGTSVYTAYIIFPEGEADTEQAFRKAQEWYVDANNQVQKANSWYRCFIDEVVDDCARRCIVRVAICAGLNAALAVATGGVSLSAAVAIFTSCAGSYCAPCLARQALQCL